MAADSSTPKTLKMPVGIEYLSQLYSTFKKYPRDIEEYITRDLEELLNPIYWASATSSATMQMVRGNHPASDESQLSFDTEEPRPIANIAAHQLSPKIVDSQLAPDTSAELQQALDSSAFSAELQQPPDSSKQPQLAPDILAHRQVASDIRGEHQITPDLPEQPQLNPDVCGNYPLAPDPSEQNADTLLDFLLGLSFPPSEDKQALCRIVDLVMAWRRQK